MAAGVAEHARKTGTPSRSNELRQRHSSRAGAAIVAALLNRSGIFCARSGSDAESRVPTQSARFLVNGGNNRKRFTPRSSKHMGFFIPRPASTHENTQHHHCIRTGCSAGIRAARRDRTADREAVWETGQTSSMPAGGLTRGYSPAGFGVIVTFIGRVSRSESFRKTESSREFTDAELKLLLSRNAAGTCGLSPAAATSRRRSYGNVPMARLGRFMTRAPYLMITTKNS